MSLDTLATRRTPVGAALGIPPVEVIAMAPAGIEH